MDLVGKLALLLTPGFVEPPLPGPTDAPLFASVGRYGTPDKWRALWSNGDTAAFTKIYFGAHNSAFVDATLKHTALPGETSFDTSLPASDPIKIAVEPGDGRFFYTHFKNGQESSDVSINTIII